VTWIRWDTRTPYHKVVGALAEALSVSPATALGHYTAVCCNLGEYQADGRLAAITDTTLETWALWTGKAGRFAAVFRQTCVEDQDGQDDQTGVVRGWWRQRALLEKQEKDASRRKPAKNPQNPRETRGTPEREKRKTPVLRRR
jgi:hypothetical protein